VYGPSKVGSCSRQLGGFLVAYLDPCAGVLFSPARNIGFQDTPGLGPPADNLPRAAVIYDCFNTLKTTICHNFRLSLSAATPQQATEYCRSAVLR